MFALHSTGKTMRQTVFGGLVLLACSLPVVAGTPELPDNPRILPMQFVLAQEGPADSCGTKCRSLLFAAGMITADTPRQFETFAADHNVRGATVVIDSDGGSVHGALAFGRAIRRLGLSTTVGRRVSSADKGVQVSPRADCESMCAFVLLGGVKREVPNESRILVHQIWLGDRRDDAVAASYTAEDLVLVQRDIGKLVRYTFDMGGGADLIDLALRIPPWEPMHALTREELKRANLDQNVEQADQPVNSAGSAAVPASATFDRSAAVTDRGWAMVDRSGRAVLARRHPLTFEGERIGSFDVMLACGESAGTFTLSYMETRTGLPGNAAPRPLKQVRLWIEQSELALKVIRSDARNAQRQLETLASVSVPASAVREFAELAVRSLTVETAAAGSPTTMIRIGNTGLSQTLPQLDATCGSPRAPRDAHARLEASAQPPK